MPETKTSEKTTQQVSAGRHSGSGAIGVTDQRKSGFRSARRHTFFVRILKFVLPIVCVGVVGTYMLIVMTNNDLAENLPSLVLQKIVPKNLTMQNPHYEGFNKDGSSYSVNAKTAVQDIKQLTLIKLYTISGVLTDTEKSKTTLAATRGTYDTRSGMLRLADKIDVQGDNGMKAALKSAVVNTKEGLVETKDPVRVEMPSGIVEAKTMKLWQKKRQFAFIDNVKTLIKEHKQEHSGWGSTLSTVIPRQPQPFDASGGPVTVTSSRLDIDDVRKIALYTGNVSAVQTGSTMTTPELKVTYEGSAAPGGAAEGNQDDAGKVKLVVAKGPVHIIDSESRVITSDSATFHADTETAMLTGNFAMVQLERKVTSDRATLNQAANTILLEGNITVVQGENIIRGRRLTFDQNTNLMAVTGDKDLPGPQRVAARFIQDAKAAAKKTVASPKQTDSPFGAAFQTDPSQPVNIEADRLDADDNAKKAVFKGDVRVVQGDFNVRTSELRATYSGSQGLGLRKTETAKPEQPANSSITRIEASGKVVITAKNGQTATGDWADFDVKNNQITLGGDVVLTQQKNVVRGTKLVIDTTTGESVLKTEGLNSSYIAGASDDVTTPPTAEISRSGRPRAVFYPDQMKEQAKGAAQNIGEGWSSETIKQR